MTTDPFGADAPRGDDLELPREGFQEDLLGLEAGLGDGLGQGEDPAPVEDPEVLAPEHGALEAPTEEDFRSALPAEDMDLEAAFGELAGDDGSTSWLMEFDLEDEGFDPEEALERALMDAEVAETAGLRLWIGRALLATVSVAAGVVGAKLFLAPAEPAPVEVAREAPAPVAPAAGPATANTTPDTAPEPTPAAPGAPEPVAVAPEAPAPVVESTGPEPTVEAAPEPEMPTAPTGTEVARAETEAPTEEPGTPVIEIDWGNGEAAVPSEPVTPPVAAAPEAPAEPVQEGGLREASPEELASVWSGTAIPVEALRGPDRVMTPGVGRVRVVLARGEVFEGRLYAVGQRKLWLETGLGKMALVDWQIDRIEHIVATDGTPLSGGDSARDLAGLPSVRVRTAGGVFYGKLLSRDGDSVVLVTDSGGRVTLSGAEVELAGKATTHVVDATGARAAAVGEAAAPAETRR